MNGKFLIKAGAVLSLADARYFSSRMVDVIGFCFNPHSPNYINPIQAQEIIKWIEGPAIAGEFSNQNVDEILNIVSVLQLDILQWKGNNADKKFLEIDLPKIISIDLENKNGQVLNDLISRMNVERDYLLLDWMDSESEAAFINETAEKVPVILNVSPDSSDFHKILETISVAGINFELGNEISNGDKSYQDFNAIFELAQ